MGHQKIIVTFPPLSVSPRARSFSLYASKGWKSVMRKSLTYRKVQDKGGYTNRRSGAAGVGFRFDGSNLDRLILRGADIVDVCSMPGIERESVCRLSVYESSLAGLQHRTMFLHTCGLSRCPDAVGSSVECAAALTQVAEKVLPTLPLPTGYIFTGGVCLLRPAGTWHSFRVPGNHRSGM